MKLKNLKFYRNKNGLLSVVSTPENKFILLDYFLMDWSYVNYIEKLFEEINKIEKGSLQISEDYFIGPDAGRMDFTKERVFFECYGNDEGAENFEINLNKFKEILLSWKDFIEKKEA